MNRSMLKSTVGATLLLLASAQSAWAVPVLGAQLYYTGGNVTVTSLPVTSSYVSELGLYDGGFSLLRYIMNDEPPGVMVTFDPSTDGINIGDELIFGIYVQNTGYTYFMGPASRNSDNVIHAQVDDLGGGVFNVGFEDLHGGGDRDYDDNVFQFTGGVAPSVPEPTALMLLALGLVGLAAVRRRVPAR